MANASHHGVRNLTAILDMNRLGQRGPTMLQWEGEVYADRAEAFGWRAIGIDGHDVEAIHQAYTVAADGHGPTLIVARTEKGHGVSFLAERRGLARQGARPESGEAGDRGAGRRAFDQGHAAEARVAGRATAAPTGT